MKKILLGALGAVVIVGGSLIAYNRYENNKRPACNSEETNEALIEFVDKEFGKTTLTMEGFSIKDVTQRPSKISDNTNVCTATAYIKFSYYGYAVRDGEINITYTTQKTLNNKVKVDIYSVGSKDLKKLND